MVPRTLRRAGAVLVGTAAGFAAAFGLCLPHALTGEPRCPRCGYRTDVEAVRYHKLPDGNYAASTPGRPLGPFAADRPGPVWYCLRCSLNIGSKMPGP